MNTATSRHPVIFFEVLAGDQPTLTTFYSEVFGWEFESGADFHGSRFQYLSPPFGQVGIRGGIGTARGDGSRVNFYVQVDDLDEALAAAERAGGTIVMEPVGPVDGYHFAMFDDPEGNTIGVVLPFPDEAS